MGLTDIASGQAVLAPLLDIRWPQPGLAEQMVTVAWQWLVLVAVIAWMGTLIAQSRLHAAFRGTQRPEISAILYIAAQRQRRQSWLWVMIVLAGTGMLFWLQLADLLPQQQLNQPLDWPVLETFLIQTPEGWLWLARGCLALLAVALLARLSLSARRQGRLVHAVDQAKRTSTDGTSDEVAPTRGRSPRTGRLSSHLTDRLASAQQRLPGETYSVRLGLVVAGALLLTLVLAHPMLSVAPLPATTLALTGAVLLTLAVWLGEVLYLAFILVPATRVIENAERTQTLVELLPATGPALAQVLGAMTLYSIFAVETHAVSFISLSALLSTPASWILLEELSLLGGILLLALYQRQRILPHLTRMAWLAARGTVMSVWGGIDVSRSLQIPQQERQRRAERAEQRLIRITRIQAVLGVLMLLCLVLASSSLMPAGA